MHNVLTTSFIAAVLLAGPATAAEQLTNGGFESQGPNGDLVEWTGFSVGLESAAKDWLIFHNTDGTTLTELVPTTLTEPGAGDLMLYVETTGHGNGIEQIMLPTNTGPKRVLSQVWVYVVSGQVIVGSGNGGNTGPNATSATTGQWELLEGFNVQCPANLAIIYAWTGPAEFYVDLASIEDIDPGVDLDGSGAVDIEDLLFMLAQWGPCAPCCIADVNNDQAVDIQDLLQLLAAW